MRIDEVCNVPETEKRITDLGIKLLRGDWKLYPGCESTYSRRAVYGRCKVVIDLFVSRGHRHMLMVRLYATDDTVSQNMICTWDLPGDAEVDRTVHFSLRKQV